MSDESKRRLEEDYAYHLGQINANIMGLHNSMDKVVEKTNQMETKQQELETKVVKLSGDVQHLTEELKHTSEKIRNRDLPWNIRAAGYAALVSIALGSISLISVLQTVNFTGVQ